MSSLEKLKQSAKRGGYEAEISLREVVSKIKVQHTIELAVEQASLYLAEFEHKYPDIRWPRVLLRNIQNLETIEEAAYVFRDKYTSQFHDTVGDLFATALDNLEDGYKAYHRGKDDVARNLVAGAVTTFITVRLFTWWKTKSPQTWAIYERAKTEQPDEEEHEIMKAYRSSEEFIDYQEKLWLEVAERISQFPTLDK
jgi:hypothetical protein